jgi:O-antigen ligase
VLFVAISIPVVIFSTTYVTRLFTISLFRFDPSALFRLIMWQSALNEFLKHPFTGVGIANFYYVTKLFHSGFCHNLYLNTFAETGVIGGVAILWFVGAIFYKLVRVFRRLKGGYMKTLNICLIGSWTAFFVNNLFDQATLFIDRTSEMKFLWLLVAVTAVFVRMSDNQIESRLAL